MCESANVVRNAEVLEYTDERPKTIISVNCVGGLEHLYQLRNHGWCPAQQQKRSMTDSRIFAKSTKSIQSIRKKNFE